MIRAIPYALLAAAVASASAGSAQARGKTVVVYGDSFSAGAGTDLRAPELWPNKLERLLQRRGADWQVSNRSINGNGLTWRTRCFGDPAIDRLEADARSLSNDAVIVLMAGVNDTIQPNLPAGFSECFAPADWPSGKITARLKALKARHRQHRILVATVPPFAASEFHSARAERIRREVNRWIRANWREGDVIDLEAILGRPSDRSRLRAEFDSGDGLHPNEAGAAAIANYVRDILR